MLWSIDSCQNSASADQYHMTVLGCQVSTIEVMLFFGGYLLTNYYFSTNLTLNSKWISLRWFQVYFWK